MTKGDTLTPSCCILYTTDPAYLFPTLVSAMQARQNASTQMADVIIFCLGLDAATEDAFAPVCAREGIALIGISRDQTEGQSAMLARLFLNRFVPAHYTDYLYLDGDVQIHGSLDPLLTAVFPSECLVAANDPMTFLLADKTDFSKDLREHLRAIGLTELESLQYFNSGVLRMHRDGWRTIGLDAWEHYKRLGSSSRFPDQDALNLAALHRRRFMSLRWNFPTFLRHCGVGDNIQPRIEHFMSSPKPWHGSFPPWDDEACKPYLRVLNRYPKLINFNPPPLSAGRRALYYLQQNSKRLTERVSWGMSERRIRILGYQEAHRGLPASA